MADTPAGSTIWLIDDNEALRFTLGLHLTECGFSVVEMAGSVEALDRLDAGEVPQLIVTDLELAQGQPNGLALARMAKLRLRHLPVIFLIGSVDLDQEDIGDLGKVVLKPVDLDVLVNLIRWMIDH